MKYVTLILIHLVVFSAFGQEDCKLKKDEDGIKVYTCAENDSKFKSLKAEFSLVGVTTEQLKTFLMNGDNYKNWQYNMAESKVLQRINEDEMIVRSVINAPWPVTDREMIVHVQVRHKSSREMSIHVATIKYDYPASKDLVRVSFSDARWEVSQLNEKDLTINYSLRLDPGGSIPSWLVNMAMAEGPYETFKNLGDKLHSK